VGGGFLLFGAFGILGLIGEVLVLFGILFAVARWLM
jgi:hypothetical protein